MKTAAVQNYSIVIRDIPTDVDRSTVERYLSGLLGNESVAIHLVEDAKPYDKIIAEKDEAVFKVGSGGRSSVGRPPCNQWRSETDRL